MALLSAGLAKTGSGDNRDNWQALSPPKHRNKDNYIEISARIPDSVPDLYNFVHHIQDREKSVA